MSSQVIPGGSQNSCCQSHSYRERAILEGGETRIKWALHTRKPVSTSQWSQGRITPLAEVASGCWNRTAVGCSTAPGTDNLLTDSYRVLGKCWLLAPNQTGVNGKSASEFNRVLVPNFSDSQIPLHGLVLWGCSKSALLFKFIYPYFFSFRSFVFICFFLQIVIPLSVWVCVCTIFIILRLHLRKEKENHLFTLNY